MAEGGAYQTLNPFTVQRAGIGICDDKTGTNDHMRSGKFCTPVGSYEEYAAGSGANFGYSFNVNNQDYLNLYLCDASKASDIENSSAYFKANSKELERSPSPACEAGTDKECGAIDPKFSGRWVILCGHIQHSEVKT